MRSLDTFPLILFDGVCRPVSIDLCDPQWLSRKGCSVCGCACGGGHRTSVITSRSLPSHKLFWENCREYPFWLLIVKPIMELSVHLQSLSYWGGGMLKLEKHGLRTLNPSQSSSIQCVGSMGNLSPISFRFLIYKREIILATSWIVKGLNKRWL